MKGNKIVKKLIASVLFLLSINTQAQTSESVSIDSLPKLTTDLIAKKYGKYSVGTTKKIIDKKGVKTFIVIMLKGNKEVSLNFNQKGDLINTIKVKVYSFDGTEPKKAKATPSSSDGHSGHSH